MFAPSINKPTQNVGHEYLLCSPREAICVFGVSPLSFSSSSTSTLKPIRLLSLGRSSCLSSSSTCQLHCAPLKKSKPMQACSCDLFNGPLPTGRVPLFPELFLPGFGAISKRASVFPLREAWCSLLAGCDNGPHMVVLQRITKTWGPGAWAQAPALPPLPPKPAHKALFFSAFCPGPFTLPELCRALLSSYLGAWCLSVHSLSFVHSTYNMHLTSIPEMQ